VLKFDLSEVLAMLEAYGKGTNAPCSESVGSNWRATHPSASLITSPSCMTKRYWKSTARRRQDRFLGVRVPAHSISIFQIGFAIGFPTAPVFQDSLFVGLFITKCGVIRMIPSEGDGAAPSHAHLFSGAGMQFCDDLLKTAIECCP
jgi:hypothetical protein